MTALAAQPLPAARELVACSHCTLPVPRGLIESGAEHQFCCHGCRTAFELIRSCGLGSYYRIRDTVASGPRDLAPAKVSGKRFSEFDDPAFRALYVTTLAPSPLPPVPPPFSSSSSSSSLASLKSPISNLEFRIPDSPPICSTELFLESVHCAACIWLIEKLPAILPGVLESRLDLRRSIVRITWCDSVTRATDSGPARSMTRDSGLTTQDSSPSASLSTIARTLDSLGYTPHPVRGHGDAVTRDLRRREDRRRLVHLAVAGACAGNVMLLAFALYAGLFDSMEHQYVQFFRWLSMLISLVSLSWPGAVFFRSAWAAIRTRTMHLDLPIAIGLGAGAVWGVVNTVLGRGEIYFDSLSVLVFALLLGRYIQHRQQRWSADAVELLFSLTPSSARRVEPDGAVRDVPIEAVAIGDTLEVRAGDSVPADGIITRGRSRLDQSLLSGESRPVPAVVGAAVAAGSVNLEAPIRIRVEATGETTRIGRLMRLVADSAQRRAPIVRMADRLAGWFTAAVLTLAAATLALWLFLDPARAIDNTAALLIVTCPCAVGLATPLAMTVAIGRAARRRILIKGADALECLSRPGTIFLDKTGTITQGKTSLVRWIEPPSSRFTPLPPLLSALESTSSHPIARAIVSAFPLDTHPHTVSAVVQTTGAGIEGRVDGHDLIVGSPAFLRQRIGALPQWAEEAVAAAAHDALTPVVVAIDGAIAAAAALGDPVRDDSRAAVEAFCRRGWRIAILSGDHPDVVAAVGRQLGLAPEDCRGGASPEAKLAAVRAAAADGQRVVMVGDGVNDAAALAAATVGIAVHAGAEASLAAADIYLATPGIAPIANLMLASRRTVSVITRALAASVCYNALAAALAITGVLNPIIAAILMPLSSLTVVTFAFRARTFAAEGSPS